MVPELDLELLRRTRFCNWERALCREQVVYRLGAGWEQAGVGCMGAGWEQVGEQVENRLE